MTTQKAGARALFGGALIGALFAALVGTSLFPGTAKLVAPLTCPADTATAEVVRVVTHPKPGTTSFTFELYCLDAEGFGRKVGNLPLYGTILGVYIAGFTLLAAVGMAFRRTEGA